MIDRRRVSVQWFSGTILTGLCGAALIGGAVFASLDGEMTFAKVPERVEGALRGAFGANDRTATLHKSDRLPPPSESSGSRNVHAGFDRHPRRQPRRHAGSPVRPYFRQSVDDDERSQLQDPAVQRPAHADRRRHHDAGRFRGPEQSRGRRARRRGFLRDQGSRDGAAEGETRRRGRARRSPDAGTRCRELARLGRRPLHLAGQRRRRRQRRAVRSQARLRRRRQCFRSLCRLRNPRRAGKRHPAAEDQGPDHRRQPLRRARSRREEGRHALRLDPARPGRDAR